MRSVISDASFGSRLRSAAVAARVGVWLAVCFGLCFATGLLSHYAQLDSQPVPLPAWPVWGYRVTQGLHVSAGVASIPLLLVKLWSVYPRLFRRPPRDLRRLPLEGLERASIAVLVAASLLEVGIGLMNATQWYAWDFSFRKTHFALAWVVIGALLVHIAVKLPTIREVLFADVETTTADRPNALNEGAISRRGLLRGAWAAAAVAVVTASTAAGTLPGLQRAAVLAPRSRRSGIPINRTAHQARVLASATASWACRISYDSRQLALTRAELAALPQATHELPIACVEGWSASGTWTGVPIRTLLDRVGAPRGRDVRFTSLEQHGPERVTVLPATFADDDRTLLALALDGEQLSLDHGYPARLIAPNRPGALQTKWVSRIEVL